LAAKADPIQYLIHKNAWSHISFTYSNATRQRTIYVNGIEVINDIATIPYQVTGGSICLGTNCDEDESSTYALGSLDTFKLWNKTLSPADVQSEYASQAEPKVPLKRYDFEQISPDGNYQESLSGAFDLHTANIALGANGTGVNGGTNKSASFNGTNAYAIGPEINLAGKSFTISFWAKQTATTDPFLRTIFSVCQTPNQSNACLKLQYAESQSGGQLWYDTQDITFTKDNINLSLSTYTHLALVQNFDNPLFPSLTLYRNGIAESWNRDATATRAFEGNAQFCIGVLCDKTQGYLPSGNYFRGQLDEFRIFTKALTASEIGCLSTQSSAHQPCVT